MRKMRKKRESEVGFDKEVHKEKERKRIAEIRKHQRKMWDKNEEEKIKNREKEKQRKRDQRLKKKQEKKEHTQGSILKRNKATGKKQRRKNQKDNLELVQNLELKVKMFSNENRRLKRRLTSSMIEDSMSEENTEEEENMDISKIVLENVSPCGKKRALKRLKLSNPSPLLKNALRLDKIDLKQSNKPSTLKNKVLEFLNRDQNSLVVPDKKKSKKGLRYRLSSIKTLWEKFLVEEENADCSYSQFTRNVPANIIKPKPEDWGTCLCMLCLNPELKLE